MKPKYIIIRKYNIDTPILFPNFVQHKECLPYGAEVVSAGHFSIVNGKVEVCSRSVGLNVEHRPEDAALIQKFIFGN